jgi:LacI family transcriptional regulator
MRVIIRVSRTDIDQPNTSIIQSFDQFYGLCQVGFAKILFIHPPTIGIGNGIICIEPQGDIQLVRNVGQQVDAVIVDNYKAAREAVEYLITMGHRKIAMINGNMDLTLYRERFAGYRKALEDAGIPFVRELVVEDESKDSDGYAAMNSLLKHEIVPDAVFASSDPKAAGVIRAIKDWGWKVPEDISVIGFDDLDMSALLDPPLTTISQPLYQMGARAAQRLIELIEGTKSDKPVIDIMETQLMIRGTVSFRFS